MNIDVLSSIIITAAAAIVVTALASSFGDSLATRLRAAAWLGLWFVLVSILGATGVLDYQVGLGTRGLGIAVALPVAAISVALARARSMREALMRLPLWLLNAVQSVRVIGILFLILYAQGRLPVPFAPIAGWGDILVGITAPAIGWIAYRRPTTSRTILWVWNFVGIADLLAAVGLGATSALGPLRLFFATPDSSLMVTLPWLLIPGFLLPLLTTVHVGTLIRLAKTREPVVVGHSAVQPIS
jgi:hypothetical protein